MMDDFEEQLKDALARKEPSPFFEARVLGAVKRGKIEHRASSRMWWASALAASLLVITGSAWQHERNVREEVAGKEAKARPSNFPFHELPNVLITPHNSSSTEATADRRWSVVAANLDRFARGEKLENIVLQT